MPSAQPPPKTSPRSTPERKLRLSRADWVAAGLSALLANGPEAVAIEPVATALGATKGSGYWHFAHRQALLEAVLEQWHATTTVDLIAHVERHGGSPRDRLRRLLAIVTTAAQGSPGEQLVVASHDPAVRRAVERTVAARMGYLSRLARENGSSIAQARTRATLAYSTYLGYAALCAATPAVIPRRKADRRQMLEAILEMAMPGVE